MWYYDLIGPWAKKSAADWSAVARPTSSGYKAKQALAGALAGAPPPYIHSLWWSSVELLWRTMMGAVCRVECSGLQGSGALYDLPVPGSVATENGPTDANLSVMALITSAHVLPLGTMLPVPREDGTMMTSVETLPKVLFFVLRSLRISSQVASEITKRVSFVYWLRRSS